MLGIIAEVIATEEYERIGALISIITWLAIGAGILKALSIGEGVTKRRDDRIELLVLIMLSMIAIMEILSWISTPNLFVTARLSTSPIVITLCMLAALMLLYEDIHTAIVITMFIVPVMAAGRFTFHIMGGAPSIESWSVFELRCITELLIPFVALVLLMSLEKWTVKRKHFIKEIFDYFVYQTKIPGENASAMIRKTQIMLCALAFIFSVYSMNIGGYLYLNVLFGVPAIVFVTDRSISRYLISLLIVTKLIYDFCEKSFLSDTSLYWLLIAFESMALLFSLTGNKGGFSLSMMGELTVLISMLVYYSCCSVARNTNLFYWTISMYGSEIAICLSYLLFAVGQEWTNHFLLFFRNWLFYPDDDIDPELNEY